MMNFEGKIKANGVIYILFFVRTVKKNLAATSLEEEIYNKNLAFFMMISRQQIGWEQQDDRFCCPCFKCVNMSV